MTKRQKRAVVLFAGMLIGLVLVLYLAILPLLKSGRNAARRAMAQQEMQDLGLAMSRYSSDYNRPPCANTALSGGDVTFGDTVPRDSRARFSGDNSEVMSIIQNSPGNQWNPRNIVYLNARRSPPGNNPGVGPDGVYRDPWGNPYLITLDANGDGVCDVPTYGKIKGRFVVKSLGPDGKAAPGSTSTPPNADNLLVTR